MVYREADIERSIMLGGLVKTSRKQFEQEFFPLTYQGVDGFRTGRKFQKRSWGRFWGFLVSCAYIHKPPVDLNGPSRF